MVDVMEPSSCTTNSCIIISKFITYVAMGVFQLRMSLASLQHLHILQDMLKDYALGEHLLLVGNQVGACTHAHQ